MEKSKKEKSIAKSILFYVCVALIAVAAIFAMFTGRTKDKPTFVFGRTFLWVKTESMETTIPARSYILVKKSDGKGLEKGDVIVFRCNDVSSPVYGSLVTHRIYEVTEGGYKTKGDNVLASVDPWTVQEDEIVAVYVKNLKILTYVGRVFSSGFGFMLIAVIFVGLCGALYVPDIVKALKEPEDEKATKEKQEEMERRIREEVRKLESGETVLPESRKAKNKNDEQKENEEKQ